MARLTRDEGGISIACSVLIFKATVLISWVFTSLIIISVLPSGSALSNSSINLSPFLYFSPVYRSYWARITYKTSIGRIGLTGKTHQYGLFQHNTLCVSSDNEALGLIDLQHFHNDDFDTSIDADNRPIEEKKTICWINALRATREKLKGYGKKVITVADRDGDFFEFLHELADEKIINL